VAGSDPRHSGLFPRFDRQFLEGGSDLSQIGRGALGGKASGLAYVQAEILPALRELLPPGATVSVPSLVVVATDMFDAFMERNGLVEVAHSDLPDDQIAHAFQRGELPAEILGDLDALVQRVRTPLAVRSSSLLEDALAHPFAGVYATKMIPNNQEMADDRFLRLTEAIKFVYASTFFAAAKAYRRAVGATEDSEKMAVVVQEVVGERHSTRFYPEVSGVARSYNYYPMKGSSPDSGTVGLALGLGKTIVDGGTCWSYDPARPATPPPTASVHEVLAETQTAFWAVNMGAASYDPVRETEYLTRSYLSAAEADGTLTYVASTYDPGADRLCPGIGCRGPRVIDFAPVLALRLLPLNDCIQAMVRTAKEALGRDVEIEFAATLGRPPTPRLHVGFLQVRPMATPASTVTVTEDDFEDEGVWLYSDSCLGNGALEGLRDIVYVKPEGFDAATTPRIAQQLARVNRSLAGEGTGYVLIGFGRWGTSEPWLGIPVQWGEISGAKVIVEAALPSMHAEMSQGSHFFQNLVASGVFYFSTSPEQGMGIDWQWLASQTAVEDTGLVRHVTTRDPFVVRVDGKSRRGVIIHHG